MTSICAFFIVILFRDRDLTNILHNPHHIPLGKLFPQLPAKPIRELLVPYGHRVLPNVVQMLRLLSWKQSTTGLENVKGTQRNF